MKNEVNCWKPSRRKARVISSQALAKAIEGSETILQKSTWYLISNTWEAPRTRKGDDIVHP